MDLLQELPYTSWDTDEDYPPLAPFSHYTSRHDEYVGRQKCHEFIELKKIIQLKHGLHSIVHDNTLVHNRTIFNSAFMHSIISFSMEHRLASCSRWFLLTCCIHKNQYCVDDGHGKHRCHLTVYQMLDWSWRYDQGRIFNPLRYTFRYEDDTRNKHYLNRALQVTLYANNLLQNIRSMKNPIFAISTIMKEFNLILHLWDWYYFKGHISNDLLQKIWNCFVFHVCTIAYYKVGG